MCLETLNEDYLINDNLTILKLHKISEGRIMKTFRKMKIYLFLPVLFFIYGETFAADVLNNAVISTQIFNKVKENNNWKIAFQTAKDAQIVFMNISPDTNPKNEIGMETHEFDQIIFVVEGNAKTILDDKTSEVKAGDIIFIPQGVKHNVINMNANEPLKILSVYSSRDIPVGAIYKHESDEPHH